MIYFRNIGYLGRLGNQLFQFASAVGIAKKNGYGVLFPIENCFNKIGGGPIDPKTGIKMEVKCDVLDCFDVPEGYFISSSNISPRGIYSETDFKFNPQVLSLPPNTDLYGYFQDERYFKEERDLILSLFKFKEEHENRAFNFLDSLSLKNEVQKVSVHIRRGDYTLYPDHHPVCSKDYYQKALSRFDQEKSVFLIFSDDIDWCKGEFLGDNFIFVDTGSPYSDLKVMSLCDHHIIANSSYSWWGAWLNLNPNKRVIAPVRWFGPAINKDASEIYCEGWEKI